eukprot:TRINITY_DN988_c0_g1_i2.p1 TRINITY_DN988_c0_g1~~TRINITY_DN988_c0_g1_i2.p1  ORF type:complete len:617 (+),score=121.06 TRINITY_DN988_c0_g1_i2:75-1925(+)
MGCIFSRDHVELSLGQTYGIEIDDKEESKMQVDMVKGLERVDAYNLSKFVHFTPEEILGLQQHWKAVQHRQVKDAMWHFMMQAENCIVNQNISVALCELVSDEDLINFPVCIQILSTLSRGSIEEQLSFLFCLLDSDNTSWLLHNDIGILVDMYKWRSDAKTEQRREHIFHQLLAVLDANDDGRIGYVDFIENAMFIAEQLGIEDATEPQPVQPPAHSDSFKQRGRNGFHTRIRNSIQVSKEHRRSQVEVSEDDSSEHRSTSISSRESRDQYLPVPRSPYRTLAHGKSFVHFEFPYSQSQDSRSPSEPATPLSPLMESNDTFAIDVVERRLSNPRRESLGSNNYTCRRSSTHQTLSSSVSHCHSVVQDPVIPGSMPELTFEVEPEPVSPRSVDTTATFEVDALPSIEVMMRRVSVPSLSPRGLGLKRGSKYTSRGRNKPMRRSACPPRKRNYDEEIDPMDFEAALVMSESSVHSPNSVGSLLEPDFRPSSPLILPGALVSRQIVVVDSLCCASLVCVLMSTEEGPAGDSRRSLPPLILPSCTQEVSQEMVINEADIEMGTLRSPFDFTCLNMQLFPGSEKKKGTPLFGPNTRNFSVASSTEQLPPPLVSWKAPRGS